jgi:Cytochrome c7 and related cytochrome c/Doubled CXXCH motif (Paired_CXXCH_1)
MKRENKGIFSDARLPIAVRYVIPESRRRMIVAGLLGCLVVAAGFALTLAFTGPRVLSPGPVSSQHANFERNCASCHTSFRAVASESCLVCHARVGEGQGEGRYSFASHYVYLQGLSGSPPASGSPHGGGARRDNPGAESGCAGCHTEHGGRQAAITAVADAKCMSCHRFGSFNGGHPEFEFARAGGGAAAGALGLHFSHRLHVQRVRKEKGFEQAQQACLSCHQADSRGEHFQPVRFESHCAGCHLPSGAATARLPIAQPGAPQAAGVWTLDAIAAQEGGSAPWVATTNPAEFQQTGGKLVKRPVHHADPWVLDNLLRIRRQLHPELGLAELLPTNVGAGGGVATEPLYLQAITRLRQQVNGLRGSQEPEVQQELKRLEALLAVAESRVRESGTKPPVGPFLEPAGGKSALPAERAADLRQLALDLTGPCQQCHVVEDAAILRAGSDRRVLARARFSHRAHLLQRPFCTDCHGAIAGLADGEGGEAGAAAAANPLDDPHVRNIPKIAVCRECHTPSEASNRCVTCHLFHPDTSHGAALMSFLGGAGGE